MITNEEIQKKPECPFCKIEGKESAMKQIADADSIFGELWKCSNH